MVAYTSLFHIDFSLEKQIIWLFSRIWSNRLLWFACQFTSLSKQLN